MAQRLQCRVGTVVCEDAHRKCRDTAYEREREQGEGKHDDGHMDAEQRRIEYGHDVAYLRIHLADVAYKQEKSRHEKSAGEHYAEASARK